MLHGIDAAVADGAKLDAQLRVRLTIHHKFRSNLAELRQEACRARLLMNGRLPDATEGATWCFA